MILFLQPGIMIKITNIIANSDYKNNGSPNQFQTPNQKNIEKLEFRKKIVKFFIKNGLENTIESLNLNDIKISRATLFRWVKSYKNVSESAGFISFNQGLAPKSTKPLNFRKSKILPIYTQFIKEFRKKRFGIGKEKLSSIINKARLNVHYSKELEAEYGFSLFNLPVISPSSIGRVLKSLKFQRSIPRNAKEYNKNKEIYLDGGSGTVKQRKQIDRSKLYSVKKLRRNDYKPESVGDLIQLDAITIQYKSGKKVYFISGIDLVSRIAYNKFYSVLNSKTTADFIQKFEIKLSKYTGGSIKVKRVQNDNGQENHKHFIETLNSKSIIQFWNYPRSPKMNAFVEKFNHTVQNECIEWYLYLIRRGEIKEFNEKLEEWNDFYNQKRPHKSLQYYSPVEYYNYRISER